MNQYYINASELKSYCTKLRAGDKVYLSGCVYTSRDAAHKRIFEYIKKGTDLPYKIQLYIMQVLPLHQKACL